MARAARKAKGVATRAPAAGRAHARSGRRTQRRPASVKRGGFRVRIRMYRQGIGDAFLLSFKKGSNTRHILIDCGVLTGTEDGKGWATRIAEDVVRETGGRVDAIVGTHPHWDHLSGFYDAQDIFADKRKLKVGEVWMSWAENPDDAWAAERRRELALQLDAARRAMAQLAAADDAPLRARAAALDEILSFNGPAPLGAAGTRSTDSALEVLRSLVANPRYCDPGDLLTPAWLPGVRVYVLAPPRDERLLRKMLGKKGSEMYGLGADSGFYAGLLGASLGEDELTPDQLAQIDSLCPFEQSLRWSPADVPKDGPLADVVGRYRNEDDRWRAIDNEWLLSAEALALKLDTVVNNLSLVLAFELVETGEVLLFPADAQIGNWLSWKAVSWEIREGNSRKTVRPDDLLARTVFYKVGHHGSHNATLMDGGLEGMSSPELVAAIPVDQVFANKSKKWDMPAKPLYERLLERTRQRVLRADGKGPTSTDPKQRPEDAKVWAAFEKRVKVDESAKPLFVDYLLR